METLAINEDLFKALKMLATRWRAVGSHALRDEWISHITLKLVGHHEGGQNLGGWVEFWSRQLQDDRSDAKSRAVGITTLTIKTVRDKEVI